MSYHLSKAVINSSFNFYPVLLGIIRSECEGRAALVYQLYTKGLTIEQIREVIETVYGRAYSKQQISYLGNSCREDVEAWLNRRLSAYDKFSLFVR